MAKQKQENVINQTAAEEAKETKETKRARGRGEITVILDDPLPSGISKVTIFEPRGGDLRGVKVSQMDDDIEQFAIVVPRITSPVISAQEYLSLYWNDIRNINQAIVELMLKN